MVNMIQSIRMDLSLMSMFGIIGVYQLSIVINVLIVRKVECQFCCKNQIMCFLIYNKQITTAGSSEGVLPLGISINQSINHWCCTQSIQQILLCKL